MELQTRYQVEDIWSPIFFALIRECGMKSTVPAQGDPVMHLDIHKLIQPPLSSFDYIFPSFEQCVGKIQTCT